MATHNLELYVLDGCPFCSRVLRYMKAHGIELPIKNVSRDPEAREYLINAGGKLQAPCLFIDGKALYESLDIIDWLEANFEQS